MSDEFVPLAAYLRPPPESVSQPGLALLPADEPKTPANSDSGEWAQALGAVARFRAAVADALDFTVEQLLKEIAENVVARELELADADLSSIVAKARERFWKERIIAVRVHPRDRDAFGELEVEKILDQSLEPGDVIAELQSGTIDLRLQTRLELALEACGR
jgi:flagellar biosynthesis/type III secretory pathway protein FliH